MEFTEPIFIAIFLPLVLFARILLRDRFRNAFVLLVSLAFSAWGNPLGALTLVAVAAFNFVVAGLMARTKGGVRKGICAVGIAVDVTVLCLYKYLPTCLGVLGLPLGLSYYVFQVISYLVDVYRGTIKAERRFGTFLLYVSFFPKMITGPIARYGLFPVDCARSRLDLDSLVAGLERFAIGFSKKVLLADVLARTANVVFDAPSTSVPCLYCWIGSVAFMLQIYYDFSGCSDMAIGISRALGFRMPENFDHPYSACSIQDFWRRWHMSLSTWFRDYIYIPLGGNRMGAARMYLNQCAVFLLCGAWHGATWTFVVWGAYHGLGLLAEKLFARKLEMRMPRVLMNVCVLLFVLIGWVLFRSGDFGQAVVILSQMFAGNEAAPYWSFVPYYTVFDISGSAIILVGALFAYPAVGMRFARLNERMRMCISFGLFAVAYLFALTGAFSPSIYGKF